MGGKKIHNLLLEDIRSLTEKQQMIKARSILCVGLTDIYVFEPDPSGPGDCKVGKRFDL